MQIITVLPHKMIVKIKSEINTPGTLHSVRNIASAGRNCSFNFNLDFTELFGKDSLRFQSNLSKDSFVSISSHNLHCVLWVRKYFQEKMPLLFQNSVDGLWSSNSCSDKINNSEVLGDPSHYPKPQSPRPQTLCIYCSFNHVLRMRNSSGPFPLQCRVKWCWLMALST